MVYLACTPPEGRENSKYMIDHIHKVLQEPSAVIEDPFRVLVFDDFLPKDYFDKLYCDGSWEVEKFGLKKGDHLKMHKHKKKNTKWYVGSDAIFPLKNTDWDRAEISKKYVGVKIKDIIGECKK